MKTAFFGLGLALIAASANAIDYEVASCAELADIDDTTVTSLTITSSPFECDSYTRFPVRGDMVLKADLAVDFSNFALKVLGSLTVEPAVTFRGVTEQMTNGGALYIENGASATFMGTTRFTRNSVFSQDLPPIPREDGGFSNDYKRRSGGAVFNKGELVFEGNTFFVGNEALIMDSTSLGRGGAVYNARIGTISFNGRLTATGNSADGSFEGQGGAIFNAGDIVVGGASSFTENTAADGGAIYTHPTGTVTFNDFATFTQNTCFDFQGGAIASFGALNLLGGSLFLSNYASGSGDGGSGGGIYNGAEGSLSFGGDSTFDDNSGYAGGAIYNGVEGSISPPQDGGELIFQNSRGEVCPDIYNAQANGAEPICGP